MESPEYGQRILTLNAGASSLKFGLFASVGATQQPGRDLHGLIERLGTPTALLQLESPGQPPIHRALGNIRREDAVPILLESLQQHLAGAEPVAVGHRIVHGGPRHGAALELSPAVRAQLRELAALDPEHMPLALALVEALEHLRPELRQFACFDTMFHHQLPLRARLLPLPWRFYEAGIRRFGFHGLSYQHVMDTLAAEPGSAAGGRIVIAHLGSGCSLAAIRDGRCVDTTMGLTPAGGVPMGTRSGDLDPGVVEMLMAREGIDASGFARLCNRESGLLGISGTSADVRDLLAREAEDDRAAAALELFCYEITKRIGSFAAALGGLDQLVFTGGIGEHAGLLRDRICAPLGFLGVVLDPDRNTRNMPRLSLDSATVAVRVIPADEELVIARTVIRLLDPRAETGTPS